MMRIDADCEYHDGEILELINSGDTTSSGTGLSITMPNITTGSAKGISVVMEGATTNAKGISVTMDALTTGDMLYLDNGGSSITGDGKFINCNDDDTSVFSVASGGLTTIAGGVIITKTTSTSTGNTGVTTDNYAISLTLTLDGDLEDDSTHDDIEITNDKVLATSVVIGNASVKAEVYIHTVTLESFTFNFKNISGSSFNDEDTIIFNFVVL